MLVCIFNNRRLLCRRYIKDKNRIIVPDKRFQFRILIRNDTCQPVLFTVSLDVCSQLQCICITIANNNAVLGWIQLKIHEVPKVNKQNYGKHLQTYVNNLNKLIAGTQFENMSLEDIIRNAQGPTFNNAAQTWNHTFFFMSLTPEQKEIPSTLSDKINSTFGPH